MEGLKLLLYIFIDPSYLKYALYLQFGYIQLSNKNTEIQKNTDKPETSILLEDTAGISCTISTFEQGLVFTSKVKQQSLHWRRGTRLKSPSVTLIQVKKLLNSVKHRMSL